MSTSNPSHRRSSAGGRRNAPHKTAGSGSKTKIEPLHPTDVPPDIHSFREWNLGEEVQGAIAAMQISVPTPIQKLAIGPVMEGRDVIAKAETGTGKTLAFGAPMMAKIDPARASVLGLVLCPTRELAEQVAKVLAKLGEARNIKVALIVGGEPLGPQVAALKAGSQVVVGTPGRVLDLYNQKFLSFPWTEFAVLDEADVMLEIGFIDDVKMILSFTPDERQTLLFSATFPPELLKLAREYTKNPAEVATAAGVATVDTIEQMWMKVDDEDRPLALTRLIEQSEKDDVFLIFCDRRTDVDRLMRRLERMPYSLKALHGGYDQEARFRVMTAFRTGEVKGLVATDVASRGLDVAHVTHVVNYGSPRDVTAYTHRIGRTGRAGREGRAITFVTRPGMVRWKRILEDANWNIAEVEPPGPSRGNSRGPRREDAPMRIVRGDDEVSRERSPADRPERERTQPKPAERTDHPRERTPRESAPREPSGRQHGPSARGPRREPTDESTHGRAPAREEAPRSERERPQPKPTERVEHPRERTPREPPASREPLGRQHGPSERGPRREHTDESTRERSSPREEAPRSERERPQPKPTERVEHPRPAERPPAARAPSSRAEPRDDVLPPVREPLRQSEVQAERERLRERASPSHAEHAPRRATHEPRTRREPEAPAAGNRAAPQPEQKEHTGQRGPRGHTEHREPRPAAEHRERRPNAPAEHRERAPQAPSEHRERRPRSTHSDSPSRPARSDRARPEERASTPADRPKSPAHPPKDAPPRAGDAPSRAHDGGDRGRPRRENTDARPGHRSDRPVAKEPAREHRPRPHTDRSDFGDGI